MSIAISPRFHFNYDWCFAMDAVGKMDAVEKIEQAYLQLIFAFKMLCYVELEKIDKEIFDGEITLLLERRNHIFSSNAFDRYYDLVIASENNFNITLGYFFITIDEAFEARGFGKKDHDEYEGKDLRIIVSTIRNAFAHNMALPQWHINDPKRRRIFCFNNNGEKIEIDLSALHGKTFSYDHIGGPETLFHIKLASARMLS